jgi:hypothetical protein
VAAHSHQLRIVTLLSEPYDIDGQQVVIGASAGIALAPADGETAEQLLGNSVQSAAGEFRGLTDGGAEDGFHSVSSLEKRRRVDHPMRSMSAALTALLARRAPRTVIDEIVASASSGVTSSAIVASPMTWMRSLPPAAFTASKSSRL